MSIDHRRLVHHAGAPQRAAAERQRRSRMRRRLAMVLKVSLPDGLRARVEAGERQRKQHAESQRRHRLREKTGAMMVTLAVTPAQTAKLAGLRYLRQSELENRKRIGEAIAALLDGIEISDAP